MKDTIPAKTELIDTYFSKLVQMYSHHLLNSGTDVIEFTFKLMLFLKKHNHSNTFAGIVTSIFVVKFGLSPLTRHTTTTNRVDQLREICIREGLDFKSYKTEYSTKTSVIISKPNVKS